MRVDPLAALERAIGKAMWLKDSRRPGRPGEVVSSAPGEDREALAGLRASHVQTVRRDIVALYIEEDRGRLDRLHFDKQISRARSG